MIHNIAADTSAFTSNAFLVDGDRTTLVDAGSEFDAVAAVEERTGDLDAVVLTHTHPDHVGNVPDLREAFDVETWGFDPTASATDNALDTDDTVQIGDADYTVVHTPGHKDDHVCLYSPETGICFAGDLVFADGGYGRTDLDEGDHGALVDSIERLREVVAGELEELHPGHGPSVTQDPLDHVDLALRMARGR